MDLLKLITGKKEEGKKAGKNNNITVKDEKRPASAQSSNGSDAGSCNVENCVKSLEDFIFNTEKLGIDGLAKQYRKLETHGDASLTFDAFKINMNKNRYSDVFCRDSTRVKLRIDSTRQGDYIHANFVKTPDLHDTFICTQGPMQNTVPDFWRMIFQERAISIMMLCKIMEEGRPKCVGYWPENGKTEKYGCIRVENVREVVDDINCFETIDLLVNFDGEGVPENEQPLDKSTLSVKLIKWPNWPDRGVPDEKCHTVPQSLLARVRHGPCVVHCSAGIGRTGCIVALEFAHRRHMKGKSINFEKITKELRRQRAQCVQTEIQYLYIHRVMVAFARGENGISEQAKLAADAFLKSYDDHLKR